MAQENLGNVFFRVGADTKGLERAEKEMLRFVRRTNKSLGSVSRSMRGIKIAIIAVGVALTGRLIRTTIQSADAYNVLQQRIKTATRATGDYISVSRELERISNSIGSSLRTNVGIFQALARTSAELGATNTDMLKLTETLNQLGVIGGSTTEEMKNGLRQFTQSMSSGIVRAEEFNSILENIPEVASRIGEGLGLTVGELRQAVITGKVLSKDVFDALLSQSDEINEQFKEITVSVDRAGQSFKNALEKLQGELFKASGSSDLLANSLIKMANILNKVDSQGVVDSMGDSFIRVRIEVETLAKVFDLVWGSAIDFAIEQILRLTRIGLFAFKQMREAIALTIREIEKGDSALSNILQERRAALEALDESIILREQQNVRDAFNAEQLEKSTKIQDEIVAAAKKAAEEKRRNEALDAFFQTNFFRKQKEGTLAEQAKSFRDQISLASRSSREFFELNKALNLSSALMEAPSAILSAFNFGSKFGGPPLGFAFATVAAAATGALIGQIASAQFRGGRQTGGPVTSGGAFRVNETGGPELLSVGNRDFLLTGDQGGNITANKKMNNGSNVMMNVTIINNGEPAEATVEKQETSEGFDLVVMLDRIDESVANGIKNGDSRTNEAIQGTFALNRAAGSTL